MTLSEGPESVMNIRQFVAVPHPYVLPQFTDAISWMMPTLLQHGTPAMRERQRTHVHTRVTVRCCLRCEMNGWWIVSNFGRAIEELCEDVADDADIADDIARFRSALVLSNSSGGASSSVAPPVTRHLKQHRDSDADDRRQAGAEVRSRAASFNASDVHGHPPHLLASPSLQQAQSPSHRPMQL